MKPILRISLIAGTSLFLVLMSSCKESKKGVMMKTNGLIVMEGRFGKITIDVKKPRIVELWLREVAGTLAAKNILSLYSPAMHSWAVGGYSYVVDTAGNRYESRCSKGHQVESKEGHLRLRGIKLMDANGHAAPLTEEWNITVTRSGELSWKIERNWEGKFAGTFSGAPALFFNSRPNEQDSRSNRDILVGQFGIAFDKVNERPNLAGNGVISSLWYNSEYLDGFWSVDYFTPPFKNPWEPGKVPSDPGPFARNLCVTVKDVDTWAVAKLYTSFPLDVDLYGTVRGHLYRRGSYDDFSEIGAVASIGQKFTSEARRVETTALTLGSQPKENTGYLLAVKLPDVEAAKALRLYYNGLLNGGTLCDMKEHDYGNETDGWRIGFTPWFVSLAMSAGVPGVQPVSAKHISVTQAIRESLDMRLAALYTDGRLDWGFTQEPGKMSICFQFSLPLAAEKYWLHTGDLDWLRQRFDKLELATSALIRNAEVNDGLVGYSMADKAGAVNWYFDGIKAEGSLANDNIFYYAALRAMAEMSSAVGKPDRQVYYTKLADTVKMEFNRTFWSETACGEGNPAYFDWVDKQGIGHGHFMSLVQYPAIVYGLASREQGDKILKTANRRIAVLEKEKGYTGEGTLDLLWPVAQELCVGAVAEGFGKYQNGGMLLTWTYWEIVARALSGDATGAWNRMQRFAARAGCTNWFEGENSFTMDGKPFGWGSEPYLSDQITVPAALVDGFLGARYTINGLNFAPHLPPGWKEMSAEIQFLGHRYSVTALSDGSYQLY